MPKKPSKPPTETSQLTKIAKMVAQITIEVAMIMVTLRGFTLAATETAAAN